MLCDRVIILALHLFSASQCKSLPPPPYSLTHSFPSISHLLTILLHLLLLVICVPLSSIVHRQNSRLILQHVFTRPSISSMNVPRWIAIEETQLLQGHGHTERELASRMEVFSLLLLLFCVEILLVKL